MSKVCLLGDVFPFLLSPVLFLGMGMGPAFFQGSARVVAGSTSRATFSGHDLLQHVGKGYEDNGG